MIYKFLCLLVTTSVLCGCSRNLPEQEQYEKLQQSLVYSTYQSASEVAVESLMEGLQVEIKKQSIVDEAQLSLIENLRSSDAHGVLGLMWVLSQRPAFAIAEANLSLNSQTDDKNKYRMSSILAIALYQKGWTQLASETSIEASAILDDETLASELYYEQVSAYLAYGILSLKEGDMAGSQASFAALSNLTGITWLPEAAESMLLVKHGRIQEALTKLKKVSENPELPELERYYIHQIIDGIEAGIGDIDGEFFMVKVFGKIVFERILEQDDSAFQELVNKLETLKDRLPSFGA